MAMSSSRINGSIGSIAVQYGEQRKVVKGRGIYYVMFANSPVDFYIASEVDWIQSLQFTQEMETIYMQENAYALDENCLQIGFPVAARYLAGDLAWYRAKLIEFDNKKGDYIVEFVDFAHEQVNNFYQLRALPAKMGEYPPMALHCRLLGAEKLDHSDAKVAPNFCNFVYRVGSKGKCIVDFLTDTPPQYVVRIWNPETGEELLPEILGPMKEIRSTASASAPVRQNVIVVDAASGTNGDGVDLMSMSKNIATSACSKTTQVHKAKSDSNLVTENGAQANDCAESDNGTGFDFLGDIVQKLKSQCNVGQPSALNGGEHFPPKPRATIATAPAYPKRDAATQTLGVLQPNNTLDLTTTMEEFFPNIMSFLMNS